MDYMPPNQEPTPAQLNFRQQAASKVNIEILKKKLNLKFEAWDAISFFKAGLKGSYVFNIIKFVPQKTPQIEYEVSPVGLGHKFIFISADETGIFKEESILGDPLYVLLNNYIKGGMQGYLFKKCSEATDMANNIIKFAQMNVRTFPLLVKANVAVTV